MAIGGVGFTLFPNQVLELFLSNGDYGEIMPRMTGMFMCALSFLIFRIIRNILEPTTPFIFNFLLNAHKNKKTTNLGYDPLALAIGHTIDGLCYLQFIEKV